MALMIGCIWHGLDALQGTRAKPGNHLVQHIQIQSLQIKISQQTTFVNTESSCRTAANTDNSQIIRSMLNYAKLPSLQSH